ncbi:MAG: acyl-CoA dehydrogenase family protein [Pseudomonadota bacterium]
MLDTPMNLGMSPRASELHEQVRDMVDRYVRPAETVYSREIGVGDRWQLTPVQLDLLGELKARAREAGLWNLWLTATEDAALNTVDYAYLAEEMGRSPLAAEVFNCSAPDTGNMEVLHRFASAAHKREWLAPLLDGEIRSAYLMTEPDVACSDATNIAMSCRADGDHYVLNGEKWWASGAGDPRCQIYIVMVRTGVPQAPRHQAHSMVLVPAATPGIEILRAMEIYGHDDAPHGHMHLRFTDVRVPRDHLLLGEGRGFEIAQARLGPGRIHHCMRAIGMAEEALRLLCERAVSREAFGKPLAQLGANGDIIAECRMEIEMARLLCLKAAWMIDQGDARAAAPWISQIKVVAPRTALKVLDEAIQMHGGAGVSQDTPLARSWTLMRTLRLADGPDAVHRRQIARQELRAYTKS